MGYCLRFSYRLEPCVVRLFADVRARIEDHVQLRRMLFRVRVGDDQEMPYGRLCLFLVRKASMPYMKRFIIALRMPMESKSSLESS
jgi:hypothetical protein